MPEGSVEVDSGVNLTQQTSQTDDSTNDISSESQVENNEQSQVEDNSQEETQPVEYTEKGTRRDPNPQSAVHQDLANTRAKLSDYEKVLSDPQLLLQFAKAAGYNNISEAKEAIQDEIDEYSPEKLQTAQDVSNALNSLSKQLKNVLQENSELKKQVSGMSETSKANTIYNKTASDIATIREKYPELNPKSPNFNPELEERVGRLYQTVDFDQRTGSWRGSYSLADIAEEVMGAARIAMKQGSEQAQKTTVTKQQGRIVTSTKQASQDQSESGDPGTAIAQKVAKALKR